jgi:hypothetical protein
MNLLRRMLSVSIAAAVAAAASAQTTTPRAPVLRKSASVQAVQAPTATYSTELPLVQRFAPADGGQGTTLNLSAAHPFTVTLNARDQRTGNTGPGVALPQNDLFGYFSIPALTGNGSNPEVFVKIIDGRALNGNFWVFFSHLTDLEYDLTVTEVATAHQKVYHKAAGQQPGGFATEDFPSGAGVTTRGTEAIESTPNAFVRTAVDIANHTPVTITADLQYTYRCTSPACAPANGFYSTQIRRITLDAFGNFHDDDIVELLGSQSLLQPGADQGSTGTLLVTFNGLPGNVGWEATAQARVYNRIAEPDAQRGTVGFGMNGSLFFESTNSSVTSTVRDTRPSPGLEGALTSHVGIRNSDIFGTGNNVNVDLSLYDPDSHTRVGNVIPMNGIAPGEVRLINDVFSAAGVPNANKTLIVFADVRSPTQSTPTIEGFVLWQDTFSGDTRFFEMRCGDPAGHCGGQ